MRSNDEGTDFLRGANAITSFINTIISPPITRHQFYHWAAKRYVRVGKVGSQLVGSKTTIRDDLATTITENRYP